MIDKASWGLDKAFFALRIVILLHCQPGRNVKYDKPNNKQKYKQFKKRANEKAILNPNSDGLRHGRHCTRDSF